MHSLKLLALGAVAVCGCTAQSAAGSPPAPQAGARADTSSSKKTATAPGLGGLSLPNADPFPSTYKPFPSRPTLIRNATVMTAAGATLPNASVLLRDGKIAAVGSNLAAPADAVIVDGTGKYVTPGIIDTHSHLGVFRPHVRRRQ